MSYRKTSSESQMGSEESDDEFYNVKLPSASSVVNDNKNIPKESVKKAYSPPRTKVRYDYKFDSSSDDDNDETLSQRKCKIEPKVSICSASSSDERKKKDCLSDKNKLSENTSKVVEKINEELKNMKNTSENKMKLEKCESAVPSGIQVKHSSASSLGVVSPVVVVPSPMIVPQSHSLVTMGPASMIVPSAIGIGNQNVMIPSPSMLNLPGNVIRDPNAVSGIISTSGTGIVGMSNPNMINAVNNQGNMVRMTNDIIHMQGNIIGIPNSANIMPMPNNMINSPALTGICMTGNMMSVQGNIASVQNSCSIMGLQGTTGNLMANQTIMSNQGNILGSTSNIIPNPRGVMINPSNLITVPSIINNQGNIIGNVGNVIGNPGSMILNMNNMVSNESSRMNFPGSVNNGGNILNAQTMNNQLNIGNVAILNNEKGKNPPNYVNVQVKPSEQDWSQTSKPETTGEIMRSDLSQSSDDYTSNSESRNLNGYDESTEEDKLSYEDSKNLNMIKEIPNTFKNDGSFMEMFKKMNEAKNSKGSSNKESSGENNEADSSNIKKPSVLISGIIGKRRGGRVLKTGLVKKVKQLHGPEEEKGPKDAWAVYMAEVKKYREASCEEEGKTRPLRRSNDPRERVRKEQDGIILSPQRRSFNSGCFVTVHCSSPNNVGRPTVETAKEGPARRIGSGRIINRDWEFRDKENNDDGYPYRPAVGPCPRERDERFDIRRNYSGMSMERELVRDGSRESLAREKELRADARARDRERMARFPADRRRYETEEPEWFSGPPGPPMYGYCEIPVPPVARRGPNFHVLRTVAWSPLQLPLPRPFRPPRLCVPYVKTFGGPTSQHDTIELRGFEENSEITNKNKGKISSKNTSKPGSKDSRSNLGSRKSSSEEISVLKGGSGEGGSSKELERDSVADKLSLKPEIDESQKLESETPSAGEPEKPENRDFNLNLEDFLQLDNLPLLTNGASGEGNQSSSRFSQWFRKDSPSDISDTRRTSVYDELIKNIINDISESSISIPTIKESDAYFAPISPAGTTSGNTFLDMLKGSHQRNEYRTKPPSIKDLEATGRVTSVEELEAKMRQGASQSPVNQIASNQSKKNNSSTRKEEELIAFKKLLKQVVEGGASVGAVNDPVTYNNSVLSQMLNKPPEPSDIMGQAHQASTTPQMHIPQDLVYKLLHVQEQQRQAQQQQELNKLWLSGGRLVPPHISGILSPLPSELQLLVANSQPSSELLSRPEAQAILQGLRQGEITPQHLVQQLQDPAMQPRHREVLASILKVHSGSPRPTSPLMVPHDPALLQQLILQQQLRIPSPLPPMHNAFCQPSMVTINPLGTSPNTLRVQHAGLPHRVPSPRELMLHTQTIMQSALIKKKLEEQQGSFRKRQEVQRVSSPNVSANTKSPNPPTSSANVNNTQTSSGTTNINNNNMAANTNINNSNSNCSNNTSSNVNSNNNNANMPTTITSCASSTTATKSPTPLAFTPTSVLRKMTAEQQPQIKDGDGNRNNKFELIQAKLRQNELLKIQAAQSSRFLANNQLLGLRAPHQQWSMQKQPLPHSMQQGRAIVKGSGSYNPAPPPGTGLVDLPYGNSGRAVYPQRSKLTMATAPLGVQPNFYNNFPTSATRAPPSRGYAPQMGALTQPNINVNPTLQQILMSHHMSSAQQRNTFKPEIRNSFHQFLPGSGGDADLSNSPTTSNQLAHWFTPELLAQAQAQTRSGKTDSTLNMVSVEELERLQQSSAPVLN